MRRGLLVLLLLVSGASRVAAQIAVVASTVEASDTADASTTDAIDTTGATLLVVTVSWYGDASALPTGLADSAANSWTCLAGAGQGPTQTNICYVSSAAPATSATHTVTVSIVGGAPVITFLAASGTDPAPVDQQQSDNTINATMLGVAGGITPSVDDEVVVTAISVVPLSNTILVPSGYTLIGGATIDGVGGVTMGGGGAYVIQTTATATDPTWTWTLANDVATMVASFRKAVGGGPPGSGPCTLATTGAGRC